MRLRALGRELSRLLLRRGWLSSQVESEPLVIHLRDAVEESWKRQDRPFRLETGADEEHGVQYRLPQLLNRRGWLYVACALLGVGLFSLLVYKCNLRPRDLQYFGVIPSFLASVIAIGMPLVTVFGTLRRSGRWAEEYLFETTHLGWFTVMTCLTACVGFVSIVGTSIWHFNEWTTMYASVLVGLAWGLAFATLLYLTAVILEIVFCSRRHDFAGAASANMLSERLLEGFLRDCYLAAFLRAHQDHLEKCCASLKHVDAPHEYMVVQFRADKEGKKYQKLAVPLSRFTIQTQFLDYHLLGLQKLDALVGAVGSRLCLTPHHWTQAADGRGAHIGILLPEPVQSLRVRSEWFRPRRDFCASWHRHSQEGLRNLFLHEVSLRLAEFDTRGYRLHLRAVGRAASELARFWAHLAVRQLQFRPRREEAGKRTNDQGTSFDEVYEWLWLYVRLLEQILHHTAQVERTPYLETMSFVRCHQDAYEDLLEECVCIGNAEMFGLLLRFLPHFYDAVGRFCTSRPQEPEAATEALDELREMRAKWGFVYEVPSAFLDDLPPGLDPAARWRFLLFLHQFACVWIRKAKQTGDEPLVNNLAEGIANVMETDSKWRESYDVPAEADLLMARHWLILGESLSEVLSEKALTPVDLPGKLTPEFLQEQEPEHLLRFYAEHQRVDEHERGFEDLLPDVPIAMRPLGGGGVGPARWVPHHEDEMRLAFLWLLLMRPEPPQPLLAIPVDVAAPAIRADLQRIISTFTHHPKKHRIWRLPPEGQKHWIEEWLGRCAAEEVAKRRREIADAPIDDAKAGKFRQEFQENFRGNLFLIQFLVDVRAYEVDDDIEALKAKTLVPKTDVIAPPLGFGHTLGDDLGRLYGHSLDIEFVRTLLSVKTAGAETKRDYGEAIDRAAAWLKQRGCTGNEALIAVIGRAHVGSLLLDNGNFVPAWKEAEGVEGFEGRYKGFGVWEGELDPESKVLALDLRNLRPLRIHTRALRGSWVDVNLRELSANELGAIKKAREDEKKPFDELREKQNCVADIAVYARFAAPQEGEWALIAIDVAQQTEGESPHGDENQGAEQE